jgi:hypothetical protein
MIRAMFARCRFSSQERDCEGRGTSLGGGCFNPRSEGIVLQLGQLAWGVPNLELSFVDLSGSWSSMHMEEQVGTWG